MNVRVLFFASLHERVKRREHSWSLADGATVGDLWSAMVAAFPTLEPMSGAVTFAVNREYVDREYVLADGDEVAVIPPVSGGLF